MQHLLLIHLSELFLLVPVYYHTVNVLNRPYYNCYVEYCYYKFQYFEKRTKLNNLRNAVIIDKSVFRKDWIIFYNVN